MWFYGLKNTIISKSANLAFFFLLQLLWVLLGFAGGIFPHETFLLGFAGGIFPHETFLLGFARGIFSHETFLLGFTGGIFPHETFLLKE